MIIGLPHHLWTSEHKTVLKLMMTLKGTVFYSIKKLCFFQLPSKFGKIVLKRNIFLHSHSFEWQTTDTSRVDWKELCFFGHEFSFPLFGSKRRNKWTIHLEIEAIRSECIRVDSAINKVDLPFWWLKIPHFQGWLKFPTLPSTYPCLVFVYLHVICAESK